jgi:hypothetical protein
MSAFAVSEAGAARVTDAGMLSGGGEPGQGVVDSELQIDNFETPEEAQEFFESDAFAENPVGVLFDPDELAARFEAGEPVAELVKRP